MPTEYRYFTPTLVTVDGWYYHKLDTSYPNQTYKLSTRRTAPDEQYYGIRVYRYIAGGTKQEITDGTPVAVFHKDATEGIKTGYSTWDCPETDLDETDRILVNIYRKIGATGSWSFIGSYITEELGADKLNAQTWTVYYKVELAFIEPDWYFILHIIDYLFGEYIAVTYIKDFSWSPPAPPPVAYELGQFGTNIRVRPHAEVIVKRNNQIIALRKPHTPYVPDQPIILEE